MRTGLNVNIFNHNYGLLQDYDPDIPIGLIGKAFAGVPAKAVDRTPRKLRINIYAMPELKLVGYNATLKGELFSNHSIYTIDNSNVNRLLVDVAAGVNIVLWDSLFLKYAFYGRSQEFSGGKKFHTWGGVSIGYSPGSWFR